MSKRHKCKKEDERGVPVTPLHDHERRGKQLSPPLSRLRGGITLTSWMNDRLPEVLWAVLLVGSLTREHALALFRRGAKLVEQYGATEGRTDFDITVSGLARANETFANEFLAHVAADDACRDVLSAMLLLRNLPARERWIRAVRADAARVGWDVLGRSVAVCLDHQSQEATDVRWCRGLCELVLGRVVFPPKMAHRVKETFEYPHSGDMHQVRPFVRNLEQTVDAARHHRVPRSSWPEEFWRECMTETRCNGDDERLLNHPPHEVKYMRTLVPAALAVIALVCPRAALAQLIDPTRVTAWKPGVTYNGGIPNRTAVCGMVTPLGGGQDDTNTIQSAVDTCGDALHPGNVVQLSAGTFTIAEGQWVGINKSITVRGNGPTGNFSTTGTLITRTGGAVADQEAAGLTPSPHFILGPSRFGSGLPNTVINLTADAVRETNSVTVASTVGLNVGMLMLIDERSGAIFRTDPAGRGQICASSDSLVVYQLHNPGAPGDDLGLPCPPTAASGPLAIAFMREDRPRAEVKKISAISGLTVTFSSPFHWTYRTANAAQLSFDPGEVATIGAGLENMKLQNADNGQVRFNNCDSCWARNIDSTNWHDEGFAVVGSFQTEIREFYVHDAAWPQPGGAGYAISIQNGSADCLIENGIVVMANKVMVARSAGAGCVVAYNYMDDGFINTLGNWVEAGINASHMVGSHHVLFEGNYSFNFESDKTHGNAVYHTVFRNYLTGFRKSFQNPHCISNPLGCGTPLPPPATFNDADPSQPDGPQRCAGSTFYSYNMNFIGNVLGVPGQMTGWLYQAGFQTQGAAIWLLGWDDFSPNPNDPAVASTAQRDGNFDWFTGQERCHGIGGPPVTCNPVIPNSLYLSARPAFFGPDPVARPWPWVNPATGAVATLPAKARFDAGTPFAP